MISRTAEYALRAMTYLAADPENARTVREIAAVTKVPEGYLSKVMQGLNRAGLVRSQRGLHGGFTLARDPREVTILEVVNAVDPLPRITSCPLGIPSHGADLCPMHRRLDDAVLLVQKAFGDSTLSELLAEPAASRPLCEFPPAPVAPAAEAPGPPAARRRGRVPR